ncbi:MAG: FAD-dependent oxidoreductase, partial [Deferrisomatales bacterium]
RLYEGRDRLGGLLAGGLPAYRMPEAALDRDLERVLSLGVEVTAGAPLTRSGVAELLAGHAAVFLATGAWEAQPLGVPGEDLEGVFPALPFLLDPALQERARGARVVVVGGGNTALDAARAAVRRGAAEVTVLYRRDRASMPAFDDEVAQAEEEGVGLRCLAAPAGFLGTAGRLTGLRTIEMTLVPQAGGRPRPEPAAGTEAELPCDLVLLAVGQGAALALAPEGARRSGGRLWVDDLGRTSVPGLFAGGDLTPARATVADALASGKRAAVGIHGALLGGEAAGRMAAALLGGGPAFSVASFFAPNPSFDPGAVARAGELAYLIYPDRPALADAHLPAGERVGSFAEVALGASEADARAEAGRCFYCGTCVECDRCRLYCPEASLLALGGGERGFRPDDDHCKGCAVCAAVCPRDVLTLTEPG